jgi:chorismate dehydratase
MIRLGHIDYSNCVPVHARLLAEPVAGLTLVHGVPSELNRALAAGEIDAAPCSSIEYARHSGEYRILPDHVIGAYGAVQSILLESSVPLAALGDRIVAVPTASATSVVLLRSLLELRHGVRPLLKWYEQAAPGDPMATDAAAVLRIGDVALARATPPGRLSYDLGAEWTAWTGLPFAFAVWQVRRDLTDAEVRRLVGLLRESRAWFSVHAPSLAEQYGQQYRLGAARLLDYWTSLRFDFDAAMQQGLLQFYRYAERLGEAPSVPDLDIVRYGD